MSVTSFSPDHLNNTTARRLGPQCRQGTAASARSIASRIRI